MAITPNSRRSAIYYALMESMNEVRVYMPITVKGGPNLLCIYCIRGLAAVVGFLPVLLLHVGGSR
jgi:hypothetical protein